MSEPSPPPGHDVVVRYFGLLPFSVCDTCGWEGPTRDYDREAADDGRAHLRKSRGE